MLWQFQIKAIVLCLVVFVSHFCQGLGPSANLLDSIAQNMESRFYRTPNGKWALNNDDTNYDDGSRALTSKLKYQTNSLKRQ